MGANAIPEQRVTPLRRRAAVLGKPIAHSLSPVLHRAAYHALGLSEWRYAAYECDEAELPKVVGSLDDEWAGLSLTMPLKRAALEVATSVSPRAAAIGAANTLVLSDGLDAAAELFAENTDASGIVDALRAAGVRRITRPIVLGAGGTAQAAVAALAELSDGPIELMVREPQRARPARETAERIGVEVQVTRLSEADHLPDADVVISTIPAAAAASFAALPWRPSTVVFDVLYDPWPTPLAEGAFSHGCSVISGLELLLHQAGHQVALITGKPAPLAAMRAALAASSRLRNW